MERCTAKEYNYAAVHIPIRKANAIVPGLQPYYRTRSAIERFFCQIKENKRLALRFDKLDLTFFSFFALATIKALGLIC